MAKPTQSLSGWAASGTIATSIPPAEVALGQQAGRPVPSAWLNLFGSWLGFVGRGGEVIPIPPVTASIGDATGGTVTLFPGGGAGFRIVSGASVPGSVLVVFPTVFTGGTADKVSVHVDNITASGTVSIQWGLYDSTTVDPSSPARCSTASRNYTAADDDTTVDQSIASGTASLSGPSYLVAVINFTAASDAIDIDVVKLYVD